MGNFKLRGKDLSKIGITENHIRSIIIDIAGKYGKHITKDEMLTQVSQVLAKPEAFMKDQVWVKLASLLIEEEEEQSGTVYDLKTENRDFVSVGRELIAANTWQQMQVAMRLPIAVKGALMPDAHLGYGLPIGGVLATDNAVIPYGVGLDIGCMMHLTLFRENTAFIKRYGYQIKTALKKHTFFGTGCENDSSFVEHPVLEEALFNESSLMKKLKGKAARQLGTSGSGNHFVEFGEVTLSEENPLGLTPGCYTGLLSHSGSRGLGAEIARYFTQVAIQKCLLPKGAKHLAWLDLDSAEGEAYWHLMHLGVKYAKASHEVIHQRLAKVLGLSEAITIQCVHNTADKEVHDGREVIVHRKGATPAALGCVGIIPGSMATPGYLVQGKGYGPALQSASHGAGRAMSRDKAKNSITGSWLRKCLSEQGVHLIGGSVEEAPIAYKDIDRVMTLQKKQVEVFGSFTPRIVRMDKA
ncbi:RtcB family protein [Marinilabiliaceae bacterium JC017]|nr:RtcB family protein [Marinilabiliaceae bacterium JC017]